MIPHQTSLNDHKPTPYYTNASLNPYTNNTTTYSPLNPNTIATIVDDNTNYNYNNAFLSETTSNVARTSNYYIDNNMNSHYGSGTNYNYSISYSDPQSHLFDPFANTNTIAIPSHLYPSFNPNNTAAIASTIVDNNTTTNKVLGSEITSNVSSTSCYYYADSHMNPHGSSGVGDDSTLYSVNPLFDPFADIFTNTDPTDALAYNTTANNDVVGSSTIPGTSSGVNNNNMNWETEFPPGYRFCPTDGELIYYYLQRKIMNLNLPHNKIHDVNLYGTTPDKLSQEYEPVGEKEWYFFTPRDRKYKNGERPNRAAGTSLGYWKATGKEQAIPHPYKPGEVIGHKRTLGFHLGSDRKNGDGKTNWIMHEFRLETTCKRKRLNDDDMGLDLVLCKVYCHNKNDKGARDKMKTELGNEAGTQPEPEVAKVALPSPDYYDYMDGAMWFQEDNPETVEHMTDFNTNELVCNWNNCPSEEEITGIEMELQAAHGNYHSDRHQPSHMEKID